MMNGILLLDVKLFLDNVILNLIQNHITIDYNYDGKP